MTGDHVLQNPKNSLPAVWYYDPEHYQRELEAIWFRDWVCVGRIESLAHPGDYFLADIGNQSVIVTRNSGGELRAFHNTCRHRGSVLCREQTGRFRNGRIICPYHTWTYSTDGELLQTPGRVESGNFEYGRYPLHSVNVDTWRGFIFINLSSEPGCDLGDFLGDEARNVANWPLESMRSIHQEKKRIACNWKIFWENFSECYHCPRVHPELCKIMPVYKRSVFDIADLPQSNPDRESESSIVRVAEGVRTWTLDGQSNLPAIEGPSESDLAEGAVFASFTASMFIVTHADYVRSVRIVPSGPESTDLIIDWLLPEETKYAQEDIDRMLALPMMVIDQDSEMCELNQRGLHSLSFEKGILVAQEYELWHFHEWVRNRLNPES
jgi:Rieske 2Fe-2S family protein